MIARLSRATRVNEGVTEHLCGACYDWKPAKCFGRLTARGNRKTARRSYCNACRSRAARLARRGEEGAWL